MAAVTNSSHSPPFVLCLHPGSVSYFRSHLRFLPGIYFLLALGSLFISYLLQGGSLRGLKVLLELPRCCRPRLGLLLELFLQITLFLFLLLLPLCLLKGYTAR